MVLLGIPVQTGLKAEEKEEEGEKQGDEVSKDDGSVVGSEEEGEAGEEQKKEKVGFRERKIIDYENRIRSFSTPDKIFRYFASYKVRTVLIIIIPSSVFLMYAYIIHYSIYKYLQYIHYVYLLDR